MYKYKQYFLRGKRIVYNNFFPNQKKLSTLMFYATDLCDSGCKHCLIWAKRPVKHLPKDKIIEAMHSKCVDKNTVVGLEGGEFMLHPEAIEILKWFCNNHPKFDLLSNCLKPDSLIEAVKNYTPKRLYISLDGTEETYRYMRGKDGYKNVIKVIEELKDILPVSVMFTLSPYNDVEDMAHVADVCKKYNIDMRIGVYNNIGFFDTIESAHRTAIGEKKDNNVLTFKDAKQLKETHQNNPIETQNIQAKITVPEGVTHFSENVDYLNVYNSWKDNKTYLKCHSILDSLAIHPNGDVPICQNLDVFMGNVYNKSLDEIFNGATSIQLQKQHVNCNKCWVSFHRKFDVALYRTFEEYFGRYATTKLLGYYYWNSDNKNQKLAHATH